MRKAVAVMMLPEVHAYLIRTGNMSKWIEERVMAEIRIEMTSQMAEIVKPKYEGIVAAEKAQKRAMRWRETRQRNLAEKAAQIPLGFID